MRVFRSILAVFGGVVAGSVVVALFDWFSHLMHPIPGLSADMSGEEMRAAVASEIPRMPISVFLTMMAGWLLAAFVGSYLAARVAARKPVFHGMMPAILLTAGTAVNLGAIPHPVWMWVAVPLLPAVAYYAATLVKPAVESDSGRTEP